METKPLITTLRACIAHGGALPVSKLLPELVVMIANELKDDVYAQKAPGWHKGRKCALNECQGRDHYTNNQLRRRLKDDVTPDTEEEVLDAKGGTSRHEARIEEHLREIKPSGLLIPGESALKFIKCQNIFTEDFGVQTFFSTLKSYENWDDYHSDCQSAQIYAYLAIPCITATMVDEPGPSHASYTIRKSVSRAQLRQAIESNKERQFKLAMLALRLEAPHSSTQVQHENFGYSFEIEEGEKEQQQKERLVNEEYGKEVWNDFSSCVYKSVNSGRMWKPYPRYKSQCLDCGTDVCEGRFKVSEPDLMLLASGELWGWKTED